MNSEEIFTPGIMPSMLAHSALAFCIAILQFEVNCIQIKQKKDFGTIFSLLTRKQGKEEVDD